MSKTLSRRQFIGSTAVTGAGTWLCAKAFATGVSAKPTDAIHVGIIGVGGQGQVLMDGLIRMSKDHPVHIKSVCDIWTYRRVRAQKICKAYRRYGHGDAMDHAYVDYRDMLDRETDLDAVIVATPDCWHARHTVAALKRGLHVYCEAEMAHSIDEARRMVQVAHEAKRLLQIGRQRRSNVKYRSVYDNIIREGLLGRIISCEAQWNRSRPNSQFLGHARGHEVDPALLKTYGYDSMERFRNWRWFKDLGNGPTVSLGAHQMDVINWYLNSLPESVVANGGADYHTDREQPDNVTALYTYQTKAGTVRANCKITTGNSHKHYYEQVLGDEGSLTISENGHGDSLHREFWVEERKWIPGEEKGIFRQTYHQNRKLDSSNRLIIADSPLNLDYFRYDLLIEHKKMRHQTHLENFLAAIRGDESLNCPGEVGYQTAVTVLKIKDALSSDRRVHFGEDDFRA
jgi:predicted dehydrogenase